MVHLATTAEEGAVARPLKVLIELIKKDIADAELVGRPHYEAAAEKLIEARDGHFDGRLSEFYRWAEKQFGKSRATIRDWMVFRSAEHHKSFKNKHEFTITPQERGGLGRKRQPTVTRSEWAAPVNDVAQQARDEARRLLLEDSLTRKQERDADHKLALRLIDIGFKVLARELHPDKGGSREAMARLNRVRNRLKECV